MKAFTKISLISGLACLGVGIPMFVLGAIATGGNSVRLVFDHGFHVIDEDDIVTKEKTSIDAFKDIDIDVDEATIQFFENDTDEYAIEFSLYQYNDEITCKVEDEKLILSNEVGNIINFGFGWSFDDERYVKVYYPKGAEFGDIELDTSAGKIQLQSEMTCNSIKVDSSAGSVKVSNVKSNSTNFEMSAGSLTVENCELGAVDIDMSAGSCTVINSTFAGGAVDMSAGSFTATGFTLTGSLDMDMSAGSVDIAFVDGQEIGYDFDLSAGTAKINGEKRGDEYQETKGYDIILKIDASAGSVDITNN